MSEWSLESMVGRLGIGCRSAAAVVMGNVEFLQNWRWVLGKSETRSVANDNSKALCRGCVGPFRRGIASRFWRL